MSEKRFKLSKSAIPSQLSNFCDENGMMLNNEVVRILNNRDALQESNVKLFFLIKESESKIKRLEEENGRLDEENATLLSDRIKDLEMFEEVADKLESFAKENEQLKKQVENLQDALAEICATFIIEGFEIEFDGKNLRELIDSE